LLLTQHRRKEEEMKMSIKKLLVIVSASLLAACQAPILQLTVNPKLANQQTTVTPALELTAPSATVVASQSPVQPTATNQSVSEQPSSINPLTGLPVENPQNLLLPPALVSVTNFPISARPQAGLSFSPLVFELFIGEGMTRYLALFYGDYPRAELPDQGSDPQDNLTEGLEIPEIGPIRSGRLPYEYLRELYNGFIVMASAYSEVAAKLKDYVNVYGDDRMDINSAMMPVETLADVAKANQGDLGEMNLSGMSFDPKPPQNGKPAPSLWVFYAYKNQVFWRYNTGDGSYHRWQDKADGSTFVEQTDRLNGLPLTFENVVVLFVDHKVIKSTLIDLNLLYVKRGNAMLFRDGVMQEIYWTTISEEYEKTTGRLRPIRFVDAQGNPVAFKPGQTWIELVPNHIAVWETVNSEKYNQLAAGRSKGSGYWAVYFKLDD
jgi:hypothetical protein